MTLCNSLDMIFKLEKVLLYKSKTAKNMFLIE